LCSAVATMLIQRDLRRSNFYAGFWLNVAVGAVGLWSAVLLLVPRDEYNWHAAPYFIASGVVGTAAGRLFRVAAIEKVGASVSAALPLLRRRRRLREHRGVPAALRARSERGERGRTAGRHLAPVRAPPGLLLSERDRAAELAPGHRRGPHRARRVPADRLGHRS